MPPVDANALADLLAVGTASVVLGMAIPFVFRLVGLVVDSVRQIVE